MNTITIDEMRKMVSDSEYPIACRIKIKNGTLPLVGDAFENASMKNEIYVNGTLFTGELFIPKTDCNIQIYNESGESLLYVLFSYKNSLYNVIYMPNHYLIF